MDKFGIFDVLTKLSSNNDAKNGIMNAVKDLSLNLTNAPRFTPLESAKKEQSSKKPKYSHDAILQLLKRHDELSKQIDKNNKKP